jgi:enoyl-CoA hydratase/carnithine racemase
VSEIQLPEELDSRTAVRLAEQIVRALDEPDGPLVLRGTPGCFCRGVSLSEVATTTTDPLPWVQVFGVGMQRLLQAPVPTIAVVEGPAVGGGVGLLGACDRVIATPAATFAMPELLWGLVPVVIVPSLRRRVDVARLVWLALTGFARTAAEALELGLVDEVVAPEELPARLASTLRQVGRVDPKALACLRAHVAAPDALHGELERALAATVDRLTDPRVRAGISAYLRDGTPPWVDR